MSLPLGGLIYRKDGQMDGERKEGKEGSKGGILGWERFAIWIRYSEKASLIKWHFNCKPQAEKKQIT